jgi:hypothetical protein
VDSRADAFTNKSQKGKYLLNAWINDLTPPAVRLLTTRVTAGRPLIVAQAVDSQSGVDPLSLVFAYNRVLIGASAYDPLTGLIVFGLPAQAPQLKAGKTAAVVAASDYQETKNINTVGNAVMPNTQYRQARLTVVNGPTVTWIEPPSSVCALKQDSLVVVAASTSSVKEVIFRDGRRTIGVDTNGPGGIYSVTWKTGSLKKGVRHVTATVVDAKGHSAAAGRRLKICR